MPPARSSRFPWLPPTHPLTHTHPPRFYSPTPTQPPASQTRGESAKQVSDILRSYKPGTKPGGLLLDGGGFQIVAADDEKGYWRVMYESLKNG